MVKQSAEGIDTGIIVGFGRHSKKAVEDLPTDYLAYMVGDIDPRKLKPGGHLMRVYRAMRYELEDRQLR